MNERLRGIRFIQILMLFLVGGAVYAQGDGPTRGGTTPEQDSAYQKALLLKIPTDVRLRHDLMDSEISPYLYEEATSILAAYINVMDLPESVFAPTRLEYSQHAQMWADALSVPGAGGYKYNHNFNTGLFHLYDAGVWLGILEDVSPTINYRLDYADEVEIVIYSVNAKVIARIFNGKQPAGTHSITWNLKNDNGMPMPSGDYVAEVRIGQQKYVRKRIVIK